MILLRLRLIMCAHIGENTDRYSFNKNFVHGSEKPHFIPVSVTISNNLSSEVNFKLSKYTKLD